MTERLRTDHDCGTVSRRVLRVLGMAAAGALFAFTAFGQGRCRDGYGTPRCPLSQEVATAPIRPVFAPTGWKTVALDHLTFQAPDYRKEAAFYIALMGWKLRSDDGKQAVLDIGDWGSAVFKDAPEQRNAMVENFCFVIEPWNAKTVEAELRKRGLTPVAENDGKGFESFHVKDPDGWDVQIGNGNGLAKARKTAPTANLSTLAPFESTGWKSVWLDHFSFGATNYKETASFYSNLLGWKETYDEGSQHELMIGDIGNIIIRGGNPNDPNFARGAARSARIDHISFGITPWDTDGVKAELEKRGLRARIDTSTTDDIHVAAFKSYHTTTPNRYDLQISYITRDNRLALPNAVKPKPVSKQ
jgi:catechol 2,3-dioxygenase-like lactoylglutathione lyase family enzyme